MSSKSRRPAKGSGSNRELPMRITVQLHQIQAAQKPEAGIRAIIAEPGTSAPAKRSWGREPTLAKLINDALRPNGDEALR